MFELLQPLTTFSILGVIFAVLIITLIRYRSNYYRKISLLDTTNRHLKERDQGLDILHRLYAIALQSLDLDTMAHKIADAIPEELGYHTGVVSLIDHNTSSLIRYAASNTPAARKAIKNLPVPFKQIAIPLHEDRNIMIQALKNKKLMITHDTFDVFVPALTREESHRLQNIMDITTTLAFPIYDGDTPIGVFIASTNKKEEDITEYEMKILKYFTQGIGVALKDALMFNKLQKVTKELTSANKRLEELDKIKDEFLTITSHELRTPLTAIKGYAWMLLNNKHGQLEQKAQESVSRIYSSSQRLINLVNDMLDVSSIESNRVELHPAGFDMIRIVYDTIHEFRAKSLERKITLNVIHDHELPSAFGDQEKIRQVLENLLGNALKFTPDGGKIIVLLTKENQFLRISVVDTGRGISPENQTKLFKKFERLANSLDALSGDGGTGLGLYICKQYVELNKGKIWVESQEGKGSTFSFTVPIVQESLADITTHDDSHLLLPPPHMH